jgi:hypothetical protein
MATNPKKQQSITMSAAIHVVGIVFMAIRSAKSNPGKQVIFDC